MPLRVGERVELTIESLAFGGRGVARHESQVVFVALAAPGDRVLARVTAAHKRFAEAAIEEILEAGPSRREPGCEAFGRCGGCQWLHVSGGAQARAKEEALFSTLERVGKIRVPERDPIIAPAPGEELGYRSRAVLRGRSDGTRVSFGFFAEGGHELVPIPGACIALERSLDDALRVLARRRWPPGPFKAELTSAGQALPHVTLRVQGRAPAYAQAVEGFPFRILDERGRVLADSDPGFRFTYELPAYDRTVSLRARPGDFSQVHRAQNRRMAGRVLEYAGLQGGETVYDLYCGVGNLAIPLALRAGRVVGVERSASAVEDARENARANGLSNCEFHAGEVRKVLERLKGRPDLVVLNPPRSGAAESVEAIAALGARKLVYVSCNPATLARDLAWLAGAGYEAARAGAVDMFPQTFHVEAVALLEFRGHLT